MQGNYLITTNNWFYAPDGKKYKAVYGPVEIIADTVLNIKTNRNSSNWFVKVGTHHDHLIVAGCQIYYAVKCPKTPESGRVQEHQYSDDGCSMFDRPCEIYFAG
ncbi:hypothetical protein GGR27_000303 [Lewinella antarctica]|uniref:Uncharacterized protein n=1 Tax=Neolewinella antarctica TaxID=442734 RepID=A0ABX0X6I7_9BACT|nr:hypothetical protein [Neolewinella antarctica]